MFYRVVFFIFLFSCFAFSSYEKVRVGKIDSYYQDKITKGELIEIIKEIEDIFESQLGFNVFDYSNSGKSIDLLFLPPSQKKRSFDQIVQDSELKKEKILYLQKQLITKQAKLVKDKNKLQEAFDFLNEDINQFNNYLKKLNSLEITSQSEYERLQKEVKKKEKVINKKKDRFNQKKIKYNSFVSSYNQLSSRYNTLAKQFNRSQRKLEVLARSMKEVKGVAKGYKEVRFETVTKNGKSYIKKTEKNYMEKIEVYDFENREQLKTVLAHEIAHLVGVDHINLKGALMNPVLQEEQIENLWLTPEDIKAFEKAF